VQLKSSHHSDSVSQFAMRMFRFSVLSFDWEIVSVLALVVIFVFTSELAICGRASMQMAPTQVQFRAGMFESFSLLIRYLLRHAPSFTEVSMAGVCWFLAPRHNSGQPQIVSWKSAHNSSKEGKEANPFCQPCIERLVVSFRTCGRKAWTSSTVHPSTLVKGASENASKPSRKLRQEY
jgi:hypothetical protein